MKNFSRITVQLFVLFTFVAISICDTSTTTNVDNSTATSISDATSTEKTAAENTSPGTATIVSANTTDVGETTTEKPNTYANLQVVNGKVNLTKEEWKKRLSDEQFRVMRESGTEASFSGKLYNNKKNGTYICGCCGQDLFSSDCKFDSGTGWPSFYQSIRNESVTLLEDNSHGMKRVEVQCSRCDAHLGHVFDDGPKPTGKRYCMNSVSLDFVETK